MKKAPVREKTPYDFIEEQVLELIKDLPEEEAVQVISTIAGKYYCPLLIWQTSDFEGIAGQYLTDPEHIREAGESVRDELLRSLRTLSTLGN